MPSPEIKTGQSSVTLEVLETAPIPPGRTENGEERHLTLVSVGDSNFAITETTPLITDSQLTSEGLEDQEWSDALGLYGSVNIHHVDNVLAALKEKEATPTTTESINQGLGFDEVEGNLSMWEFLTCTSALARITGNSYKVRSNALKTHTALITPTTNTPAQYEEAKEYDEATVSFILSALGFDDDTKKHYRQLMHQAYGWPEP